MSTETLFELLAHFDAINALEQPDTQILHTSNAESIVTDPATRPTTRSRRTKKTHIPYSTDLQRRRKNERDALRSEVQQLRYKLEYLVTTQPGQNTGEDQENLAMWHSRAVANCEERVRSERVNQELKDILAQQSRLFESFRKVLQRIDSAQEMESISQSLPTVDRPFFEIDYSGQIFAELAHNTRQFHTKVDVSTSSRAAEECSVAFHCQSNLAPRESEHCFNITSRTFLACSVTEARDILWDYVTDEKNPDNRKAFNFAHVRSPEGIETQNNHRNYITVLFIPARSKGTPSFVNALATYRMFERAGRVFLVGGIRWILPAEGLQFEDNYCTAIDPLENGSVVRTSYQLHSRNAEITHISKATEDKVMNYIADISRCYLQCMQNAFLDRTIPFTTLYSI